MFNVTESICFYWFNLSKAQKFKNIILNERNDLCSCMEFFFVWKNWTTEIGSIQKPGGKPSVSRKENILLSTFSLHIFSGSFLRHFFRNINSFILQSSNSQTFFHDFETIETNWCLKNPFLSKFSHVWEFIFPEMKSIFHLEFRI